MGQTTMAEVARQAGVSITTVSHVLNGTRRVSDATVKRVYAAIERTGYQPNSIARALAGAPTHSLGLAISGISNPYYIDVIAAIELAAAERGYTLLLGDTHDEPQKELQMVQELTRRRVDGLLLSPSPGAERHALRYLTAQSVPVVLVDRFVDADVDQVGPENEAPTARLVEHLAGHGHRRIGFVAGLEGLSTTDERTRGYRAGLQHSGLAEDDALIAYGASQHEPARVATHRLLDLAEPPTALVAGNNAMTIGVMHALRERGLRVPEDIALVAFDDFEWAELFRPHLTVVAQPTRAIGAQAVQLLLERLDDPGRPARTLRLSTTFVRRESCGCPMPAPAVSARTRAAPAPSDPEPRRD
ncbi:MAG TPA: LacI family DNA-binding transcriptional regulator [Conexibacter sp.]|nr:LacI family DNA-binding transcriptional regulator [Conexibacter sp.]